eukprot:Mycagemm_TRINITY_DN10299_c1_g4::TRINITY_DN10299_c1_g4_i4::g.3921::m.3921 type:complete len:106 gc:universal TRINITY_DN10299_c1_g4_i4:495-178(-)
MVLAETILRSGLQVLVAPPVRGAAAPLPLRRYQRRVRALFSTPEAWPSALGRSALSASTALVMVHLCVSRSGRWRSPSTPSTLATSAARTTLSALLLVSGSALPA